MSQSLKINFKIICLIWVLWNEEIRSCCGSVKQRQAGRGGAGDRRWSASCCSASLMCLASGGGGGHTGHVRGHTPALCSACLRLRHSVTNIFSLLHVLSPDRHIQLHITIVIKFSFHTSVDQHSNLKHSRSSHTAANYYKVKLLWTSESKTPKTQNKTLLR